MSTAKVAVDTQLVRSYLIDKFAEDAGELEILKGGEHSQAFAFGTTSGEFVVRVNRSDTSFKKDAFVADHFSSEQLPIPRVLHIGQISENLFACITSRAPGLTLDRAFTSKSSLSQAIPTVVAMLDSIHSSILQLPRGFGTFDSKGVAPFSSWKDVLQSISDDTIFDWQAKFNTTCMEQDVFETIVGEIAALLPTVPEVQHLVHGDVGMDNALFHDGKISAVIDWGSAKYGDPIYDVAWLHLWWQGAPIAEEYRKLEKPGNYFIGYDERIRCYSYFIGLVSLGFFAGSNQPTKYQWLKERMGQLELL